MKEIWKHFDKENYPRYMVSNYGRVKTLDWKMPWTTRSGKKSAQLIKGRILKAAKKKNGYMSLTLYGGPKNKKDFLVHRMVAIAFIDNPEGKKCVNHKNSIRDDNRLENLEWATHSENVLHGYNHGNIKPTDHNNHGLMKTCKYSVVAAKMLFEQDLKPMVVAKMTGLDISAVYYIKRGGYPSITVGRHLDKDF